MSKNKNTQDPEINVEEALSKTEQFLTDNKKPLLYTGAAIVLVAVAIFAYHHLVSLPKQQEAMAQMFPAEQYFRADSFALALNGDGNTLGFKQIIEDYGTSAGEAVYFYAGICELQSGNYREALDYLKKYSVKDPIMSARALACIGDAYAGLSDFETAADYYKKAASTADNILAAAYLLKAGLIYEETGKPEDALKMYDEIKTKYPQSAEGYEINKYIARIQQITK